MEAGAFAILAAFLRLDPWFTRQDNVVNKTLGWYVQNPQFLQVSFAKELIPLHFSGNAKGGIQQVHPQQVNSNDQVKSLSEQVLVPNLQVAYTQALACQG